MSTFRAHQTSFIPPAAGLLAYELNPSHVLRLGLGVGLALGLGIGLGLGLELG